jgi:hypothetical protein
MTKLIVAVGNFLRASINFLTSHVYYKDMSGNGAHGRIINTYTDILNGIYSDR